MKYGIMADPVASVLLDELNDLTSSVAAEFAQGSLELLVFPTDVETMYNLNRDVWFRIGPAKHADYEQAAFAATTFTAAADVIQAVCDSGQGSEKDARYAENIRNRAIQVLEELESIPHPASGVPIRDLSYRPR